MLARTNTNGMLSFPVNKAIEELRYEFGALEAPGSSEDDSQSNESYNDQVWMTLYSRITEMKVGQFNDLSQVSGELEHVS